MVSGICSKWRTKRNNSRSSCAAVNGDAVTVLPLGYNLGSQRQQAGGLYVAHVPFVALTVAANQLAKVKVKIHR